ncbi:DUF3592 domain-containing protein [Aeoliella sp. ICT_H6.2]|uniref:DUF3592 domain-containing protein n=1 Tax=Aeoliella straminimaris TaxID=2954799 RepID=A0A9X2FCY7_9BACT|nr:DUF3592 domain-containing protein [Aeoliella straminimaris]MCO6045787.1 DUF3592 domain-containing protein [Aeoliella straminimaris]
MTNRTQRPSSQGTGCAVLFLMPFAAFGAAMIGLTLWSLVDWQRMQHWEETPARLLSLKLQRGDDTERIRAEYQYTYAGQQYTSDRVALHQMGDNLGTYQTRNYRRLKQAMDAEQSVAAYVNPARPGEAVLLRDLRPEMLALKAMFGFIFGLIGIGGLVGVAIASKQLKSASAMAQQQPDKPWRWRDDWREGEITVGSSGGFWATLVLAIIWNSLAGAAAVAMLVVDKNATPLALGVLALFILAGLGLLYLACMTYFRWQRFPSATFRMARVPGEIGGQLAGVVLIPAYVRADDGFQVKLECTQTVRAGKQTRTNVLWKDEQVIERTLDENDFSQTAIPVQFAIPPDVEPSDPHADRPVKWKLKVAAKLSGPNLDFTFEVPVFRKELATEPPFAESQVAEV